MRLTTHTQVSVDGVMQANGGRHPALDPGMERGGWARPLFDSESMAYVDSVYQRAGAFLLGRRTYDLFAAYWGTREDLENPIVGALNTRPKYVASNSLTAPLEWQNSTLIEGDLLDFVRNLKETGEGELAVMGSLSVTRQLIKAGLLDRISLIVHPVLAGHGRHLFDQGDEPLRLTLVDSFSTSAGNVVNTYEQRNS